MKLKRISIVADIAAWCIFVIELGMTAAFLWGFSNDLKYKIMFGLAAIVFECLHFYSLIKLKSFWYSSEKVKYFVMYILAATFTVLAAISFAGKTILSFSQVVNQNKVQIEDVSDQIVENKEQIKILKRLQIKYINASDSYEIKIQNDTNKLGTVDYNNIRNTKDIKKQIDIIMNSNTVLVSKYNAMLTNKSINQDSESDDSFQFYSDILKINKRWIIFVILLLFFVSIEYGFFVSAPKEDTDNDFLINNKDELFKYIDYLTDVTDIEKKLQSDKVISKLMGIDVNKCTYYRKILGGEDPDLSITFRDATNKKEPMIANKKGFSFANTTKENMKQIITNKIKLS